MTKKDFWVTVSFFAFSAFVLWLIFLYKSDNELNAWKQYKAACEAKGGVYVVSSLGVDDCIIPAEKAATSTLVDPYDCKGECKG